MKYEEVVKVLTDNGINLLDCKDVLGNIVPDIQSFNTSDEGERVTIGKTLFAIHTANFNMTTYHREIDRIEVNDGVTGVLRFFKVYMKDDRGEIEFNIRIPKEDEHVN